MDPGVEEQCSSAAFAKILSSIKRAGRIPRTIQQDSTDLAREDLLTQVHSRMWNMCAGSQMRSGDADRLQRIVPIVFTSAVKGTGIGSVRALLQSLPLPADTSLDLTGPALNPEQPSCLFHIEDRFSFPASYVPQTPSNTPSRLPPRDASLPGYLRFGECCRRRQGPDRAIPVRRGRSARTTPEDRPSPGNCGLSTSHPSSAELSQDRHAEHRLCVCDQESGTTRRS